MKDFYQHNPEAARKVGRISQLTWDRCPEIKAAMSTFNQEQTPYMKSLIGKQTNGSRLNSEERRMIAIYYKNFWNKHPEMKELLSKRKLEVIEELKNS